MQSPPTTLALFLTGEGLQLQIPSLENPDAYTQIAERNPVGAALLVAMMVTAILYRVLPYILDRRRTEPTTALSDERRRKDQDKWNAISRQVSQLTIEVRQIFGNHSARIEALESENQLMRSKLDDVLATSIETNTLVKEVMKRLDRSSI